MTKTPMVSHKRLTYVIFLCGAQMKRKKVDSNSMPKVDNWPRDIFNQQKIVKYIYPQLRVKISKRVKLIGYSSSSCLNSESKEQEPLYYKEK